MAMSTISSLNAVAEEKEEDIDTYQFTATRSFVPDCLVNILHANLVSGVPTSPFSKTFRGICLIVDISGFTRLSGAFCSQGKNGIDGLQSIVNGYMGSLVKMVYEYGGDVIKFAGDALICLFEPNDLDDLYHVAIKAVVCAWTLKDVCTTELTAHIAISLGDICLGILGGIGNHWECLISGSCMSQLSQCLDDAPSKNVALTKECYEFITENIPRNEADEASVQMVGTTLPSTNVLLASFETNMAPFSNTQAHRLLTLRIAEEQEELKTLISRFVPRPVNNALISGTFDFLAELREVTTVFIKWDGYDDVEHKDLLSIQKHFACAQEVIEYSGGFLRQFLVDDKGCVLIAMWGVPAATFPDNCLRALWTAVTLCEKLRAQNMPISCGMTTGNVYCGTVGSPMREEYAAIGDVVNLAARLMSKAKGSVFIDEASYTRLPEGIQSRLIGLPGMLVKGKDQPIKPFKYVNTTESFDFKDIAYSTDTSPIRSACRDVFVSVLKYLMVTPETNRRNSLFLIPHNVHPVQESAIQFVVVEGAVGTGKAHAVAWLRSNAERLNLRSINIHLMSGDAMREFDAVEKLFRQFIREENFDNDARQSNMVNQLLLETYGLDKESIQNLAYPTLRKVLGVTCPLKINGRTVEIAVDKKVPQRLQMNCITEIFKTLMRHQPVVIAFEGAQFLDESSWQILHALSSANTKAMIVLTTTPLTATRKAGLLSSRSLSISSKFQSVAAQYAEVNFARLLQYRHCNHVTLNAYTFQEVRMYLAHCLHVRPQQLPPGLDQLVYKLSGANPLWISEICDFIKMNGVEEFMNSMADEKQQEESGIRRRNTKSSGFLASSSSSYASGSLHATSFMLETSHIQGAVSAAFSHLNNITHHHQHDDDNKFSLMTPTRQAMEKMSMNGDSLGIGDQTPRRKSAFQSFVGTVSSMGSKVLFTPRADQQRNDSSLADNLLQQGNFSVTSPAQSPTNGFSDCNINNNNNNNNTNTQATQRSPRAEAAPHKELGEAANNKLSFLITTRFSKLSADSQNVARSASIIGQEFTEDVLASILSAAMKPKLPEILKNLIHTNWIVENQIQFSSKPDELSVYYSFVHSIVYQTIHDLTPISVRYTVHLTIAKYIENNVSPERFDFTQSLAYHYSRCQNQQKKAYEYLTKSALECIVTLAHKDVSAAIDYIHQASEMVEIAGDATSLIAVVAKAKERVLKDEARKLRKELKNKNYHRWLRLPWRSAAERVGPYDVEDRMSQTQEDDLNKELDSLDKELELIETELESEHKIGQAQEWQLSLIYLQCQKK